MRPVRPAASHEQAAALRQLFSHLCPAQRDARAASLLGPVLAGAIRPDGLFVLPGLAGAVLAVPLPGATGLFWPPSCHNASGAAALIETACARLRRQGARLIQSLVPPGQEVPAAHLSRNGFRLLTTRLTLVHPLGPPGAAPAGGGAADVRAVRPGRVSRDADAHLRGPR
jgi:hypothetical protein